MAIPRFILSNPYRIIGIPANCSEREIVASLSKVSAYARVGKPLRQPLDMESVLGKPIRNRLTVDSCNSIAYTTSLRMKYAMVWFSVVTPSDGYALDMLRKCDMQAARNILEGTTGYSSCINRAVIDFMQGDAENAVRKVVTVIFTPALRSEFVNAVLHVQDKELTERELLALFIELLSESYSFDSLSLIFSKLPWDLPMELLNCFYREKWTEETSQLLSVAHASGNRSLESMPSVIERISHLLTNIEDITPADDLSFRMLCDRAGRTVLEVSIDAYNNAPSRELAKKVIKYLKFALSVARSTELKNRCRSNYIILLENLKTL